MLAIDGGAPVRTKPFPSWPIYDELEEKLMIEVVKSGSWGGAAGTKIPQFESAFAQLHNAKYGVAIVNGTMAITVALKAVGVEPGDEVITPPYTFIASASATLLFGAVPVFVDVDPDTLMLDPAKVEAAITPKTKAILAVHIGGGVADMDALRDIAKRHRLKIVEDAAQAVGAQWRGQGVGAIGDIGTFSLQSSKNLNAGEGGIMLSNNQEAADMAWSITNVGRIRGGAWYGHAHLGWNLRMTEFQAAIGLAQLTRLEEQMKLRERNAQLLDELLGGIDGVSPLMKLPGCTRHAHHLYMFKLDGPYAGVEQKATFIKRMNAEGIPVSHGYHSLNQNEAIIREVQRLTGKQPAACPVSESMCEERIIWLMQTVLLSDEEAMRDIAAAVRKVLPTLV